MLGELAQLGERLVCNQEVTGSIPVFSTKPSSCWCRQIQKIGRLVGEKCKVRSRMPAAETSRSLQPGSGISEGRLRSSGAL